MWWPLVSKELALYLYDYTIGVLEYTCENESSLKVFDI